MLANGQAPDSGFLAVWMALITTAGAVLTLWLNKRFDAERKACEQRLEEFGTRLDDCHRMHTESTRDREALRADLTESRDERAALRRELDLLKRQTGHHPGGLDEYDDDTPDIPAEDPA